MKLGTRGRNVHSHNAGGREFRFVRWSAGVGPAVGMDVVCDELHGEKLFVVVGKDGGGAVQHGGAIVVVVRKGGEGQDETVDCCAGS